MSRYTIKNIERVNPPEGASSKRWFQYIIANDINTITSLRAGSEKDIRNIAGEIVKRLNEKYSTRCKVKNYNRPVYDNSYSPYL